MKPRISDIVHFVLPKHILSEARQHRAGQHRPAIVVAINEGWTLHLQVFTDGSTDGIGKDANRNLYWATSIAEDQTGIQENTWHWPEPAELTPIDS